MASAVHRVVRNHLQAGCPMSAFAPMHATLLQRLQPHARRATLSAAISWKSSHSRKGWSNTCKVFPQHHQLEKPSEERRSHAMTSRATHGEVSPKIPPRPDIEARLISCALVDDNDKDTRLRSEDLEKVTQELLKHATGTDQCEAIGWRAAATAKAYFGLADWLKVMSQLIRYPERSSSDIRRADVLSESGIFEHSVSENCHNPGVHAHLRRELRPRRPNLDGKLRQDCYKVQAAGENVTYIIYFPLDEELRPVSTAEQIPYYHPSVRAIAFAYVPLGNVSIKGKGPTLRAPLANLEVHVAPFEAAFDAARQPQHRLSRTALRLATLQTHMAWGEAHGYKKRYQLDCVVRREDYMDLYQEMRQKHAASLIGKWVETTNPDKHVFEDIGIATFLMLLWRDMFPRIACNDCKGTPTDCILSQTRTWGRPRNFVDVGCGNGLLVHLLNAEGYQGFGIDLRRRKTWEMVEALEGGADLRTGIIEAPLLTLAEGKHQWPSGSFLIGNHADELTSWLPLIAASDPACPGLINIPCCRFLLNGQISNQSKYRMGDGEETEVRRLVPAHDVERTLSEVRRGPPTESVDSASRNIAYLRYITHLHLLAGWTIEKEALRIPSTKNWCIVSRKRTFQKADGSDAVTSEDEGALLRVREFAETEGARWRARMTIDAKPGRGH